MRALPLLFLAGCAGGDTVCTDIGWFDQLTLTFAEPLAEPGDWTFRVTSENGPTREVSGSIPEDTGTYGGESILIVYDDDAIGGLELYDFTPRHVDVRVLHDGEDYGNGGADPVYTESEPNGEGCGIQRIGTATITLIL
jgi:hypothetical protein